MSRYQSCTLPCIDRCKGGASAASSWSKEVPAMQECSTSGAKGSQPYLYLYLHKYQFSFKITAWSTIIPHNMELNYKWYIGREEASSLANLDFLTKRTRELGMPPYSPCSASDSVLCCDSKKVTSVPTCKMGTSASLALKHAISMSALIFQNTSIYRGENTWNA